MARSPQIDEQLEGLSSHLLARRDSILQAWRQAVREDPKVTAAAALTRKKFDDHIPAIIEALARKLRAWPGIGMLAADAEQERKGAAHGAHRWQQGYDLPEVTREWGHLQLCLLDELDRYTQAHPGLDQQALAVARRAFARLCTEGLSRSVAEYARLQQAEASARVNDLEAGLAQLDELQRRRAEDWRQAAHDLRNQVNVVTTVTAVLSRTSATDRPRTKALDTLQRNIASLSALLNDLLSVARLEAGHEQRNIAPFDAAALMRELSENGEAVSRESDLEFVAEGPLSLEVDGDAIKTQRIAQNLLLNAFKHAPGGKVRLRWAEHGRGEPPRWMLEVSNVGAAPSGGAAEPLIRELKEITATTQQPEDIAVAPLRSGRPASAPSENGDFLHAPGEGIGLSIVKRLCELLDATLEFEQNGGATFRVIFPRRYDF